MPKAMKVIAVIADFVEKQNTPGSGARYALKFKRAIEGFAKPNVTYAKCQHRLLAMLAYQCVPFANWVIVFKIENNRFTVYEIIHGSLLS